MKNSSRSGVVVGSVFGRSSIFGALTCFVGVPALANDFAQTSVYRGKIDSPYISTELVVNDFEASADTVGVGISGVVARVYGSSVDADDSVLDGTGVSGYSTG